MNDAIQNVSGDAIWDLARSRENEVSRIQRIENTSLARFKGHWYSAFREAATHNNHPTGRTRVIRSATGQDWETSALFDWDSADVRDANLSITGEGWLLLNASVYYLSPEPRGQVRRSPTGEFESYTPPEGLDPDDGLTHYYHLNWIGTILNVSPDDFEPNASCESITWLSSDGANWSSAYSCPTGVNTCRFDVTWHNGMGYSLAQWGKDCRGPLYRTRDGKRWRILTDRCAPDGKCNEGSLAFGTDETAYCLLRGPGSAGVSLGVGEAPYYQNWKWTEPTVNYGPGYSGLSAQEAFRVSLGGPKILRLNGGRLVGAGRALGPGREDGRVTLFWIDPGNAVFDIFAECDGTGYPGVVEHEGELWVTYTGKGCHEGHWDVSLAKVKIPD